MPSHKFRNEQNRTFEVLPEGDYIAEVIEAEVGISNGSRTRGADTIELKLKEISSGATFYETLIFHPSCDWKVDTFVNCMGMAAQPGEEIDLSEENIIGRRGWVRLYEDEYQGKKKNKVRVYYTDKEKVSRNLPAATQEPAAAAQADDDAGW